MISMKKKASHHDVRVILLDSRAEPLTSSTEPLTCGRVYYDVNGRLEHEALLRDHAKCHELGIDIVYETLVYLRRWGGYLSEEQ